jgi:hypothetical protein
LEKLVSEIKLKIGDTRRLKHSGVGYRPTSSIRDRDRVVQF